MLRNFFKSRQKNGDKKIGIEDRLIELRVDSI